MSAEHTLPYSELLLEAPGQDGDVFPICTHKDRGKRRTIAHAFSKDHARRLVSCVNACKGQSTEDLELGFAAGMEPMPKEDSRRIMACFQACKGIPTEALEAGVVGEMLEALHKIAVEPIGHPEASTAEVLCKVATLAQEAYFKAKGESP